MGKLQMNYFFTYFIETALSNHLPAPAYGRRWRGQGRHPAQRVSNIGPSDCHRLVVPSGFPLICAYFIISNAASNAEYAEVPGRSCLIARSTLYLMASICSV